MPTTEVIEMADDDTNTVTRSTTVQAEPSRVCEQVEDFHHRPWLAKLKRVSEGATSG
jgi:hypothetical protein